MARSAAIERVVEKSRVGPFRLVTELGEGGFAPVFLASEEYGGTELRAVALKLFAIDEIARTSVSNDGASRTARDRIIEEARALCRVEHPNVVRFFQIVEDESAGILALAMEHVRGRSLSSRIEEGTLPVDAALAVGAAIASALAAVHAVGLIHRDVKPENVIEAGGVHKLIDFGIAARARPARAAPLRISGTSSVSSMPSVSVRSYGSLHSSGSMPAARLMPTSPSIPASGSMPASASMPSVPVIVARGGDTAPSMPFPAVVVSTHPTANDQASGHTDVDGRTADASETGGGNEAGHAAGTMGYIDPVCLARGEPADPSSDLYSLGALLFECLTGRLPASEGGGTSASRLRLDVALGKTPAPPVQALAPQVPDAVARLVDSLLAPRREDRPRRAEAVAVELERLRRVAPGRARDLPPEGPFRGLAPFDVRHRDVYFGRSAEIATCLELLRSRGLVALVGPSGSGKSSLARAGVLPAIEAGELGAWPSRWEIAAFSPGRAPKRALAVALGRETLPEDPEALASELAKAVEASGIGRVVYVDALEELATTAVPHDADYVGATLAAIATHPVPGLRAIVTSRRDLLDPLLASPSLGPALARGMQLVVPLTASAWLDALDERLSAYGYSLEEGLREELSRDLSEVGSAMPLVEFALARLWDARDQLRRELPRGALAGMGGLGGALAGHAEAKVAELVARHGPKAADVAEHVLIALTTPHGTRAQKTRAELAKAVPDPLAGEVTAAFEEARLLVAADGVVTLAHDALVAQWPRLRGAVESRRRDREMAAEVEAATARWHDNPGRDRLLRGRALRDAKTLERARTVQVSAEARAFLRASGRAELRSNAWVLAFASSIFVGAGVLAYLYRLEESSVRQEQERTASILRSIQASRNQPANKVARELEKLVADNYACEKKLADCTGTQAPPSPSGAPVPGAVTAVRRPAGR